MTARRTDVSTRDGYCGTVVTDTLAPIQIMTHITQTYHSDSEISSGWSISFGEESTLDYNGLVQATRAMFRE